MEKPVLPDDELADRPGEHADEDEFEEEDEDEEGDYYDDELED
jgi:hypothetical protein